MEPQNEPVECDFGSRLLYLCKEQRISQRQLAEITGLSPSAISCYIHGTRKPNCEVLHTIAVALNVTEDRLFREDKDDLDVAMAFTTVIRNTQRLNTRQRKALVRELVKAEIKKQQP